jgi:predicted nucleic acid-binding protein
MSPAPLRLETLLKSRLLALDSMIFIYEFQQEKRFADLTRPILSHIAAGSTAGTASSLAISELLVYPYAQGDSKLAGELYERIRGIPNLRILPVGPPIADRAAKLRASLRLRLADCIHLASAERADYFVTNDRRFEKVKKPKIAILDDIIM